MSTNTGEHERRYWVVSPNVNCIEKTVPAWGRASILGRAAFMGWEPNHLHIGHKFAYEILPGHVILIGRRHKGSPQIFGFGVVRGPHTKRINHAEIPEGGEFGAARNLRPFVNLTTKTIPRRIPLIKALTHSSALAELHPANNKDHRRVCEWLEGQLSSKREMGREKNRPNTDTPHQKNAPVTHVSAPPGNYQLDFKVHTKSQVITAKKSEARLLARYRQWLKWQGRRLQTFKCNKLQCDGFEERRRNLIEAKGTTSREHLRMAVGQVLDYAYQSKKEFGALKKAILVPKKPDGNLEQWLRSLDIGLIWPEKGTFRDNAKEDFT
ncbi:MAG: hypothetical protein ACLQVL_10560 [Terriglobia bacterium]